MKKNILIIIISLIVVSALFTIIGITYQPKNTRKNDNNNTNNTNSNVKPSKSDIVVDGNTYEYDENLVAQDDGPQEGEEYNEGAYGIGE